MPTPFGDLLAAAAALLAGLPRGRKDADEARARVERFRELHPETAAALLVDRAPGSPRVDYDLYLRHPEGGTVALSWRGEEGLPWSLLYADHWAANYVVTVDDWDVPVQEALLAVKFAGERYPDLMRDLVDSQLVARALEADPPPVRPGEIQEAADRFRSARGLRGAAATHQWLNEAGLTPADFRGMMERLVQDRKLVDRVTADAVEPYFAAHRAAFERVRFCRAESRDAEAIRGLLRAARAEGGLALAAAARAADAASPRVLLDTRPAGELPPALAGAPVGEIVGPEWATGLWWGAEAVRREPARLDAAARERIRQILFREWLDAQRAASTILWHWF